MVGNLVFLLKGGGVRVPSGKKLLFPHLARERHKEGWAARLRLC